MSAGPMRNGDTGTVPVCHPERQHGGVMTESAEFVQIYLLGPLNGPRIQPTGSAATALQRSERSPNMSNAREELITELKLSAGTTDEQLLAAIKEQKQVSFLAGQLQLPRTATADEVLARLDEVREYGKQRRAREAQVHLSNGPETMAYALRQNATSEAQRIRDFQTVQDHKEWRKGYDENWTDQEVAEFKAYLDRSGL